MSRADGTGGLRELAEKGVRAMEQGVDAAGWTPSDAARWTNEASPEVVLALCDVADAARDYRDARLMPPETRNQADTVFSIDSRKRLDAALARLSAAGSATPKGAGQE